LFAYLKLDSSWVMLNSKGILRQVLDQ